NPADRRALSSRYVGHLGPGESVDLWGALVVAQGATSLGSVALLGCYDQTTQSIFDSGFAQPFPPSDSASCPQVTNCPRNSGWWAGECVSQADISAGELTQIAQYADNLSTVFDWGVTPRDGLCAVLAAAATARDSSEREYREFRANLAAMTLGIKANGTYPIGFDLSTSLNCPVLAPTDLRRLFQPLPEDSGLMSVDWEDLNPENPQALVGVDAGLPFFG